MLPGGFSFPQVIPVVPCDLVIPVELVIPCNAAQLIGVRVHSKVRRSQMQSYLAPLCADENTPDENTEHRYARS